MKIFVVIVTYNGMKWIEECLNSVLDSSISVIPLVIDNNSTDGTITFIKEKFPDVTLFEQNYNLGFGIANNIGISCALRQHADFVFLLNQDAFVEPDTIETLVNVAKKNTDYGIISPIQLDYLGNLLELFFFNFMADDKTRKFYSDYVLGYKPKELYDIEFVQAAAWLLPQKTLLTIGGFDPIFFHYGEDNNYCHRTLYHNLKIGVVSSARIRHDSNQKHHPPVEIFSEKYFKDYELRIIVNYANINNELTQSLINKEQRIIIKALIISILRCRFKFFKGYLKKMFLFKKLIKLIVKSRSISVNKNSNYLT